MSTELKLYIQKISILLGCIGILYAGYHVWSILFIIIISGFLTIIITPLADLGEKHRIPAWVTVIAIYIVLILLATIVIGTLIPIIITYINNTVDATIAWVNSASEVYRTQGIHGFGFHPYIERILLFFLGESNLDKTLDIIKQNVGGLQSFFTSQIGVLTSGGVTIVSNVGGAITEFFLVGLTTFLMMLERKNIGRYLLTLFPQEHQPYVEKHYGQIQLVFTAWIKGMLILSFSIFLVTYIGLALLETVMGFSTGKTFTLAIIGGIMEFIPYIGPLIALIPAVIIGLGISWKVALAIMILYICIQQMENNVLVPYIMSRTLDISPFFVFIVVMIGGSLGGILGIILAVPIAGVLRLIVSEYRERSRAGDPTDPEEKNTPNIEIDKKLTQVKNAVQGAYKKIKQRNHGRS